MKRISLLMLFLVLALGLTKAQDGYIFTDEIKLATTSVKDQYASGTCWAFSTNSFLESEMLRMGSKENSDISEMFIVNHCYSDKAEKYVRLAGNLNFGSGGAFHDIMYVIENYGLVPESAYPGLNYGTESHVHGEMDAVLEAYVKAVVENKNGKLTSAWKKGLDGVLEAYLGKLPESFTYNGKSYTPRTYADEVVKIKPEDYIEITSFTHHPFYKPFQIEVPDNWLWDEVYNLPLDEMMKVMDNALDNGYTIAWGADVSEDGFSHTKYGIAVMPLDEEDFSGMERAKWEDKTAAEKNNFTAPGKEKTITQELRQAAFDDYQTTDDHGMQIIGRAKDQSGTKYYIVKNSWNTSSKYDGYFYASEAFVKYKTMDFMIHKDALPKDIAKKLGL